MTDDMDCGPTITESCTKCDDTGCDISTCHDCGEDYFDPCARHRLGGHVPSSDPYTDGVSCRCTCDTCGRQAEGDGSVAISDVECPNCHGIGTVPDPLRAVSYPKSDATDEDDLFGLRAVWYVDHADGTTEDIVLDHGNVVEDSTGTVGQVLFERRAAESQ